MTSNAPVKTQVPVKRAQEVAGPGARPSLGEALSNPWARFLAGMVLVLLVLLLLGAEPYYLSLATMGVFFAALASAWNIIGGFGGQFSLGHAVFFGVGGYTVALLQIHWEVSLPLALGASLVVGALTALALAAVLFRLRGPFFAIGTLALTQVALALVNYFDWTGGANGLHIPYGVRAITDTDQWTMVFFAFFVLCVGLSLLIRTSRLGYYLIAVRDDEDAAAAAGISPLLTKTLGLVISAGLTSVGGGLFVSYLGFLDPVTFMSLIHISAFLPLLALVGGIGTVIGPVLGAFLLQPGSAYLRGELAGSTAGVSELVIGLLFVLCALYFREGIWGQFQKLTKGRRTDES
ncbi:branched-chain amino acid ABC transporter permease [Nocardioides houyundeii]|uniref:branched-chain amino acid ABC transporter permease n=1 Tax=Nocardioides houyundeii TaxID=2045452 RepID=UPI000DF182DF|nr:branched-chain amino acid ABC transporter permease [Nocardioides houyundeii]